MKVNLPRRVGYTHKGIPGRWMKYENKYRKWRKMEIKENEFKYKEEGRLEETEKKERKIMMKTTTEEEGRMMKVNKVENKNK